MLPRGVSLVVQFLAWICLDVLDFRDWCLVAGLVLVGIGLLLWLGLAPALTIVGVVFLYLALWHGTPLQSDQHPPAT